MSKDKYETHLFTGIVVEQDLSGNYVPKDGATLHRWRTGKHTKGKYKHTGQVFLTENNQSFQSIGSVMGPMFGALVASVFDYRGIFIFSALLIVLNAILFNFNTKSLRK